VDKLSYFKQLGKQRAPDRTEDEAKQRIKGLVGAWASDGLDLTSAFGIKGGRWGNSLNSQRLIWYARQQGREHEMIEEIYKANHENNLPLSDWSVLLGAAGRAGVEGAKELLGSNLGLAEVIAKIEGYRQMGISAVPVIILNEEHIISNGAPEKDFLRNAFTTLIQTGSLPWKGSQGGGPAPPMIGQ